MKFLKNQKGFTLVEILVVIFIIAILFITLLPQIDRATDRARQAGVKTDFRSFQLAAETYLRETNGKNLTKEGYDSFLDVGMQTVKDDNGSPSFDPGLDSKEVDPWGTPYDVDIFVNDRMIYVTSFGPNEKHKINDGTEHDNFYLTTYYIDGVVVSCTTGFGSNEITSQALLNEADDPSTFICGQKLDGTYPTNSIYIP